MPHKLVRTGFTNRELAQMHGECSVQLADHEVIESQLLVALSDKSKVACIFDEHDIGALIAALAFVPEPKLERQKSLLNNLMQLRDAAFRGDK